MWFITVMDKIEPSEAYLAEFGDQRTWGYYLEEEQAVRALHEKRTDMFEGCYMYAVLEKFGPGIVPHAEKRQFFKFDKERYGYFEIPEPECVKRICNFALG